MLSPHCFPVKLDTRKREMIKNTPSSRVRGCGSLIQCCRARSGRGLKSLDQQHRLSLVVLQAIGRSAARPAHSGCIVGNSEVIQKRGLGNKVKHWRHQTDNAFARKVK